MTSTSRGFRRVSCVTTFSGQTALVDLAGLRDAIAEKGGDPAKVNPVVPVQLIVDHSLAVEYGGFDKDAFAKNRAIEDRRNEDRFHFIDWTKQAFKNVDVIPPGNGIMHQINLERMSPVIHAKDGVAFPGHAGRHRQPHPARRRARRDRDRRRWSRGRERHARPRVVDAPAGHHRRRAERSAAAGHHGDGRRARADRIPAQGKSRRRLSRVLRRRRRGADARRPRDDLQHGARIRRDGGDVLHRRQTLDYLRAHRPRGQPGQARRNLCEAGGPVGGLACRPRSTSAC